MLGIGLLFPCCITRKIYFNFVRIFVMYATRGNELENEKKNFKRSPAPRICSIRVRFSLGLGVYYFLENIFQLVESIRDVGDISFLDAV